MIFIIFIGAGVYAFFVGGDSVSVPDFGDQEDLAEETSKILEENKKIELEKTKRKKEFDEMLADRLESKFDDLGREVIIDEFNEIYDEVWKKFYGEDED